MTTAITPMCARCRTRKPASEFGPDKYKASGLRSICRECHNLTLREYRATERGRAANSAAWHKSIAKRLEAGTTPGTDVAA
jgi:hypothetical protein